ncbi:lipocalin [Candidimonas sp. SYP-B2681]|uniref:lipocalin family protein n=1 Tax=Candidimonas sp. SYP-B2681 TaxID=2497686 RepID=UPI000F8908D3|nr:lipocalin family protein [Candidimonas sp. SYP-B2681]RTZ40946.1 lipocalin [Candidimonas sp. SYP-B2681]
MVNAISGRRARRLSVTIVGLVALWTLAGCAAPRSASKADLATQQNVDLSRYAGVWYEQARLPNRFQADCAGEVKAEYTLQENDRINVVNQCVKEDGSREEAKAEGRLSRRFAPPDTARLEVRFAPSWLSWIPAVWGDYWIIRLEGDYEYSLVGTPDRKYLWVLSRAKNADETTVNRLLDYAGTQGFPVQQVIKTNQ